MMLHAAWLYELYEFLLSTNCHESHEILFIHEFHGLHELKNPADFFCRCKRLRVPFSFEDCPVTGLFGDVKKNRAFFRRRGFFNVWLPEGVGLWLVTGQIFGVETGNV
jgi:hypothetical protein